MPLWFSAYYDNNHSQRHLRYESDDLLYSIFIWINLEALFWFYSKYESRITEEIQHLLWHLGSEEF